MSFDGIDENYCALALSIIFDWPPERSLAYMLEGRDAKSWRSKSLTDDDAEDMIRLKETMTYKQIGKLYGMSENNVFYKIKRYKQREEGRTTG